MPDKISERIKMGLEIRDMKQSELVEKTGIGKSSISTYISGSYEPKQRNIYKIAKALNVSEAWLMGLDVPMERNSIVNTLEVTKQELELLTSFNKLNDLGKKEAYKRILELTEISRYVDTEMAATSEHLLPVAAHGRTDIVITEEADCESELNIMKNDSEW